MIGLHARNLVSRFATDILVTFRNASRKSLEPSRKGLSERLAGLVTALVLGLLAYRNTSTDLVS